MSLVAFDFDGTLVDSMPALADLAVKIIREFVDPKESDGWIRETYLRTAGRPFDEQLTIMFPGRPLPLIARAFAVAKVDATISAAPMPGVAEFIRGLRPAATAIVSSSDTSLIRTYLQCWGFDGLIDIVLGRSHGNKTVQLKRLVEIATPPVSFIGDSEYDGEIASHVPGIRFVRRLKGSPWMLST